MIGAFIRYLFPSIRKRDRLPLLPRHYSSHHSRTPGAADPEHIRLVKGLGLARTDQDAIRVLRRHPDAPLMTVYKREKRLRRQRSIRTILRRLKRLW